MRQGKSWDGVIGLADPEADLASKVTGLSTPVSRLLTPELIQVVGVDFA